MSTSIRRLDLQETSKSEWLGLVQEITQHHLMPPAPVAEVHHVIGGLTRSLEEILSLSDGSAVYRMKKPETPAEIAFLITDHLPGYSPIPADDATFLGVDTGSHQVLSDLTRPQERTYIRQFSRPLRDFTPWQAWTPGTLYRLPKTISELKQSLRI
jgi:hypothetical protein